MQANTTRIMIDIPNFLSYTKFLFSLSSALTVSRQFPFQMECHKPFRVDEYPHFRYESINTARAQLCLLLALLPSSLLLSALGYLLFRQYKAIRSIKERLVINVQCNAVQESNENVLYEQAKVYSITEMYGKEGKWQAETMEAKPIQQQITLSSGYTVIFS